MKGLLSQILKLDRALSLPIQELELKKLEYLLVIPGISGGYIPCWLSCSLLIIATGAENALLRYLMLISSFAYSYLMWRKDAWGKYLKSFPIHWLILDVVLYFYLPSSDRWLLKVNYTYQCTVIGALYTAFLAKNIVKRERPIVALVKKFGLDKREPFIRWYMKGLHDHATFKSFFSGDVMLCMIYAFFLNETTPSYIWALIPIFSLFGRMYFWAHYFFDCVAGGLSGYCCCLSVCYFRLMYPICFEKLYGLATLAVFAVVVVCGVLLAKRVLKVKDMYG